MLGRSRGGQSDACELAPGDRAAFGEHARASGSIEPSSGHRSCTLLLAHGVPSTDHLDGDELGHQDAHILHRHQHVTDSLRQDAADAIDRSFPDRSPINDEGPGRNPGAT